MKAIQVKFLPATNFKGARMKAWVSSANQVTVPFQYEISDDETRAQDVAQELIYRLNWVNVEISGIGQLPNGNYAVTLKTKG